MLQRTEREKSAKNELKLINASHQEAYEHQRSDSERNTVAFLEESAARRRKVDVSPSISRAYKSKEEGDELKKMEGIRDQSFVGITDQNIQSLDPASLMEKEMAANSSNPEMGLIRIKTEPPDPDEELVEPLVDLVKVKVEPIDVISEQISQNDSCPQVRPEEVITDDVPAEEALSPVPVRLVKTSTSNGIQNHVKLRIGKWKQKLAGILKVGVSNKVDLTRVKVEPIIPNGEEVRQTDIERGVTEVATNTVVIPKKISPSTTTINTTATTESTFSYVILSYQKEVAAEERRRILARERQRRWRSRLTNEKKKHLNELQAKRYARKKLKEMERDEDKLLKNIEKGYKDERKVMPSEENKRELARERKREWRLRKAEENPSQKKGKRIRRYDRNRRRELEAEDEQLTKENELDLARVKVEPIIPNLEEVQQQSQFEQSTSEMDIKSVNMEQIATRIKKGCDQKELEHNISELEIGRVKAEPTDTTLINDNKTLV